MQSNHNLINKSIISTLDEENDLFSYSSISTARIVAIRVRSTIHLILIRANAAFDPRKYL